MKINTDLIIKPGRQEKYNINGIKKVKMCEDYGIKSNKEQIPMVVISDGCSSQEFSDWGSRILSMGYFGFFQNIFDLNIKFFQNGIDLNIKDKNVHKMDEIDNTAVYFLVKNNINHLGLSSKILNTTISILHIFESNVYANILNDGYLIIGYKNGQIEVNKFEYLLNAPYYLTYRFEENLKRAYYKEFPDNKFIRIRVLFDNRNEFKMERCSFETHELEFSFFKEYKVNDLDFILITTDGINTFPGIEDNDFIKKLIDFKSLNGEFIQRRVNRVFKEFEKENTYNLDDITIGGFSFVEK